jgi:hypothetical protein
MASTPRGSVATHRVLLAGFVAALAPLVLGGCGSDHAAATSSSSAPVTSKPAARTTAPSAVPPTAEPGSSAAPRSTVKRSVATSVPRSTVRPTTTKASTTVAASTPRASTTTDGGGDSGPGSATTAPGGPPCDLRVIVQQTETAFDGITPGDLHCAEDWAAWSGTPVDPQTSDGFFAVAQFSGGGWQLRNLGTASVCGDANVPKRLWAALACTE